MCTRTHTQHSRMRRSMPECPAGEQCVAGAVVECGPAASVGHVGLGSQGTLTACVLLLSALPSCTWNTLLLRPVPGSRHCLFGSQGSAALVGSLFCEHIWQCSPSTGLVDEGLRTAHCFSKVKQTLLFTRWF